MKKIFWVYFLFVNIIFSQENLDEVILVEKKITERISFKNATISDSVILENIGMNLGDLLSIKTPIYIKSYGVGGTQTPSFRGTGASHTQLFWNGINLNSPMLGQIDLSLFPVSFSDEININYGASSLTYGTGGLGGAIHLNSIPKWDRKYSILFSQTIQGFADYYIPDFRVSNYISNFSFSFGSENIQNVFKLYNKIAKNDFLFANPYSQNQAIWKNNNSNQFQNGILNETYFKQNNNNIFSLKLWWQVSDRNLPASMNNINSYSSQNDNSLRILGNWMYNDDNFNFKIITAFINDELGYKDQKIKTDSKSEVNSIKTVIFIDYSLMDNLVLGGNYNYSLDLAKSDNFKDLNREGTVERSQEIHDVSFKIESKNFNFMTTSLLFRQQILDGKIMPFLPSLGFNFDLIKKEKNKVSIKTNLSRNFKAPSLNDKYWYPVGNPDLKSENGWSYELGGDFKYKSDNFSSNIESTYFLSEINDWIVWLPGISNLWRPENLRLVKSQGIETILSFIYKKDNYSLEFFSNISFVFSRNMKPYNDLDNSVGNQLIYTPIENIQSFIKFTYKNWKFIVEENFYGERFTTTDGTEYLPEYYLTNIIVSNNFLIYQQKFAVQLRLNNIFNFHYQSIARKPMPTMNFLFTLSYNLF